MHRRQSAHHKICAQALQFRRFAPPGLCLGQKPECHQCSHSWAQAVAVATTALQTFASYSHGWVQGLLGRLLTGFII